MLKNEFNTMKIIINRIMSIIAFALCLSLPVWSITDYEIVQGLEALGDWEAAYPLAYQLAQNQNTYKAWRDVASKYVQFDTNNRAYLQAWQHAYTLNQKSIYRDFITIRSQSPLNRHAIHALFKLVQASKNVKEYLQFMAEFPHVVESIDALLKAQEMAWERAKIVNDPLVFDAFVITFPGAKQIPQAIVLAFQAEKQMIEKEFSTIRGYEIREYIARRLFNEARVAEKQQNSLVAARKYRLLNLEMFIGTKAFTEMLDREERFTYQKIMQAQQAEIANSIKEMREAVVYTIQVQTQHLENAIVNELQIQGQHLEEIIAEQNRLLSEQFDKVNKNLQQGYLAGVGADVAELVPFVGTGLKIAKVIGRVSPAITRALLNPSKHQVVLFENGQTDLSVDSSYN